MTHVADIRGARITYDVVGQGPPVLLIMGFGMSGRAWKPVLDGLADRHTLCWYDVRGLGDSTPGRPADHTFHGLADDAAALLDHLGWDRAHVAGVSMGGMISQHLALRHRGRVQSLALLATHAGGGPLRTLPSTQGIRLFLRANRAKGPARLAILEQLLFPPEARAEMAARGFDGATLLQLSTPSPLWVRLRHLRAVLTHDTRLQLAQLEGLPTLVVQPGKDLLVPPRCSEVLADHLPGARLLSFPDAGHGMLHQCAAPLNDALHAHWTSSEG